MVSEFENPPLNMGKNTKPPNNLNIFALTDILFACDRDRFHEAGVDEHTTIVGRRHCIPMKRKSECTFSSSFDQEAMPTVATHSSLARAKTIDLGVNTHNQFSLRLICEQNIGSMSRLAFNYAGHLSLLFIQFSISLCRFFFFSPHAFLLLRCRLTRTQIEEGGGGGGGLMVRNDRPLVCRMINNFTLKRNRLGKKRKVQPTTDH